MAKTRKPKKSKIPPKSETLTTTKHKPLKNKLNLNLKKLKSSDNLPPSFSSSSVPYSDSDSDDPVDVAALLAPFTKHQLVDLIASAAAKSPSLYSLLREHADRDVSRRKIFVHGFSGDTSRDDLAAALEPFGEIEECNVVTDKLTGKAKGYGFVTFKAGKSAANALRTPQKKINGRFASCQMASVGPAHGGKEKDQEVVGRKIYVNHVPVNADKEKLRNLFEKFGEIENGPTGFDYETGRCKGYALFVYKTMEGAMKALEEPHKVFEGQMLVCSKAADGKSKNLNCQMQLGGQQLQFQQPHAGQVLPQNLALFGHHSGLNPMYNGLFMNPGSVAGMVNQVMAGVASQGVLSTSQMGGLGVGSQSLGAYKTGQGLQHVYPNAQIGQAAISGGQEASGTFAGYPSYM